MKIFVVNVFFINDIHFVQLLTIPVEIIKMHFVKYATGNSRASIPTKIICEFMKVRFSNIKAGSYANF